MLRMTISFGYQGISKSACPLCGYPAEKYVQEIPTQSVASEHESRDATGTMIAVSDIRRTKASMVEDSFGDRISSLGVKQ